MPCCVRIANVAERTMLAPSTPRIEMPCAEFAMKAEALRAAIGGCHSSMAACR